MAVPAPTIIVVITEDLNLQKKSHTADFAFYLNFDKILFETLITVPL